MNLKTIELMEKFFQPTISKTESLLKQITTIISIILLLKHGIIISIITSIILNIIIHHLFIKKIKQYQEMNPQ